MKKKLIVSLLLSTLLMLSTIIPLSARNTVSPIPNNYHCCGELLRMNVYCELHEPQCNKFAASDWVFVSYITNDDGIFALMIRRIECSACPDWYYHEYEHVLTDFIPALGFSIHCCDESEHILSEEQFTCTLNAHYDNKFPVGDWIFITYLTSTDYYEGQFAVMKRRMECSLCPDWYTYEIKHFGTRIESFQQNYPHPRAVVDRAVCILLGHQPNRVIASD
jgi:hypothetical protein